MKSSLLCVGDVIADCWIYGTANRLSPEAPCPVFCPAGEERWSWGGAGACAQMAAALGADVTLAGRFGRMPEHAPNIPLVDVRPLGETDLSWPQTNKTRYVTATGQVMRLDREVYERVSDDEFTDSILEAARHADIVAVCDYGNGVCTHNLLSQLIRFHPRVVVDPARGRDWDVYAGCLGIKCNEVELLDMKPVGTSWLVTTLGDRGAVLQQFTPHQAVEIPAKRRAVRDATGCGDQFLATLCVLLAEGCGILEACHWANSAAQLQVERVGIVPIGRDELIREVTGGKIVSAAEAAQIAARAREQGKRVVFTNGCFDLFSAGHASCLREAKAQGDLLIVGLNSDQSARTNKGPLRPYRPEDQRAAIVEALEAVDYVVLFDEPNELALLEMIRPDVLVKGGDYHGLEAGIPGREFVESIGGRLHITERLFDVSSSAIAQGIREQVA